MKYIEDIQNIIDFIENHLGDELNIDKLSEMALLSKFYFQRLFYKLIGVSVMEYVRLRRVARAAEDIKRDIKISDIAFKYGFNSCETFIRSFKSVYDLTPTEYQKSDIPLAHFYKPDLSIKYKMVDMGVPVIASGVMLEIGSRCLDKEIKMAGVLQKCWRQPAGQDNPGMAWSKIFSVKNNIKCQSLPHVEFGVSLPNDEPGTFNYLAAVQVDEFCNSENDFYRFTLPAGLYIVCTFQAEDFYKMTNEALDKAFQYLFETWLPNSSRFEMNGMFAAELYDHRSLKDHPLPDQKVLDDTLLEDPPEMDIMVYVREKKA